MQEQYFYDRGISYRSNEHIAGRSTLVFIHGLAASSSEWTWYETQFEGSYNVVTVDLRAHGRSQHPSAYEGYRLRESVIDIRLLLEALRIQRCVLIGHSSGALIGLELACERSRGSAEPGT
jgi:pimeloyl-ACP methyl ester carboxylesterase